MSAVDAGAFSATCAALQASLRSSRSSMSGSCPAGQALSKNTLCNRWRVRVGVRA